MEQNRPVLNVEPDPSRDTINQIKADILRHIRFTLGNDPERPDDYSCFMGLAYSLRERMIDRWMQTQSSLYETLSKRVYYLSLEYLPGRFLKNYLISLRIEEETRIALAELGFDLDELEEEEWDAGLGNGGLGRLASCYMDSIASRNLPGYGYGILYHYGIFHQTIENGYQKEQADNWMRWGSPWQIIRHDQVHPIRFYGRSEQYNDRDGRLRYRWVEGEIVIAMACDILIPGFGDDYVTNMRLWSASSSREFDLEDFNQGDYVGAVESKVRSETISKVLYPSDEKDQGKELRLKQQYFFVAATLLDILRRYKKQNRTFSHLPNFVAIQLNDTHPAIAIPELMRLLMDDEGLTWEDAWAVCEKTFAYTNHTVMPEALETWPVELMGRVLPRHLEIVYEINRRFLEDVAIRFPRQPDLAETLSIIQKNISANVRMAHLSIIGSHAVNGVAQLHSRILKQELFKDFDRVFPNKIRNVTNGITPRRWLLQANPHLSAFISSRIGTEWICDLGQLEKLAPCTEDPEFCTAWHEIKLENKRRLARYILRKIGLGVDPSTLFDVQVKRMHEYKRQLLNVLHLITLYNRIKQNPEAEHVRRTVIFSGKAAPAYHQAKLIIKLISSVADVINHDPEVKGILRALFLPNYCVSQAEKIIPAADLSEQISTAGMEASGTGNMKMALNGALIIGTLDGANIEIMEEVGRENIFIFGLTAEEILDFRIKGYDPGQYYEKDPELHRALDMIGSGYFFPETPGLFAPIIRHLLEQGDYYFVLADYRPYITAQEEVNRLYLDRNAWTKRSILNTARMGKFSSDRAILEYATDIWQVKPL